MPHISYNSLILYTPSNSSGLPFRLTTPTSWISCSIKSTRTAKWRFTENRSYRNNYLVQFQLPHRTHISSLPIPTQQNASVTTITNIQKKGNIQRIAKANGFTYKILTNLNSQYHTNSYYHTRNTFHLIPPFLKYGQH